MDDLVDDGKNVVDGFCEEESAKPVLVDGCFKVDECDEYKEVNSSVDDCVGVSEEGFSEEEELGRSVGDEFSHVLVDISRVVVGFCEDDPLVDDPCDEKRFVVDDGRFDVDRFCDEGPSVDDLDDDRGFVAEGLYGEDPPVDDPDDDGRFVVGRFCEEAFSVDVPDDD